MKKSFSSLISPDLRAVATPLAILVGLTILSFISYRIAFSKISVQRAELAAAKESETILKDKKNVLTQVAGNIASYVNSVAVAVPPGNPIFMMISQLKSLAGTSGVTLNNVKTGSEVASQGSISAVNVNFEVGGSTLAVVDFLKALDSVAPVSILDRLKISQSLGSARADVFLKLYFSPFPENLPSFSEPIKDLTADEKDILSKLQGLTVPNFVNLAPQEPSVVAAPFD